MSAFGSVAGVYPLTPRLAAMDILPAFLAVLALVAIAAALGMWWRATSGRVRISPSSDPAGPSGPALDNELAPLLEYGRAVETELREGQQPAAASSGERATFVQFSSDLCGSCASARRTLARVAAANAGTAHVEINLSEHGELAARYGLLTTPTTFIFDGAGKLSGRIAGAPRQKQLQEKLTEIIGVFDAINA